MVTFPEIIHPKYKMILRFEYNFRALQYLEYFKIIESYPRYKFFPLDLTFDDTSELYKFLYERGIIYSEREVKDTFWKTWHEPYFFVDTRKIYEVEESIQKYLLNYKYYSINEVAEMLSMSRPTIYKLVKQQTLKAIRIYGQLRINHLHLVEFINNEKKQ